MRVGKMNLVLRLSFMAKILPKRSDSKSFSDLWSSA
jgi:hypothetical protein